MPPVAPPSILFVISVMLVAGAGCAVGPPGASASRSPAASAGRPIVFRSPAPSAGRAGAPRPPASSPDRPSPLAPGRQELRARVRVPYAASGEYAVVRGDEPARPGRGNPFRYLVEVERGLPFEPRAFAAEVHRILNDVRGWGRFRRVEQGPVRVRVALSSPHLTVRQCHPLRTGGQLSCWNGTRSVINALRWAYGVPQYRGDLAAYRRYLISHEVGHGLGHHHRLCPGSGRLAPVMAQQSKSLGGCRPNPWPFPERGRPGQRP